MASAEGKDLVVTTYRASTGIEFNDGVLNGTYLRIGNNHGRPVYSKKDFPDDNGPDVQIYFWESDNDTDVGWWFGRQVGSDKVWARHTEPSEFPPAEGWNVVAKSDGDGDRVELRIRYVEPARVNVTSKREPSLTPSGSEAGVPSGSEDDVPYPWIRVEQNGSHYYWNEITGDSSWKLPTGDPDPVDDQVPNENCSAGDNILKNGVRNIQRQDDESSLFSSRSPSAPPGDFSPPGEFTRPHAEGDAPKAAPVKPSMRPTSVITPEVGQDSMARGAVSRHTSRRSGRSRSRRRRRADGASRRGEDHCRPERSRRGERDRRPRSDHLNRSERQNHTSAKGNHRPSSPQRSERHRDRPRSRSIRDRHRPESRRTAERESRRDRHRPESRRTGESERRRPRSHEAQPLERKVSLKREHDSNERVVFMRRSQSRSAARKNKTILRPRVPSEQRNRSNSRSPSRKIAVQLKSRTQALVARGEWPEPMTKTPPGRQFHLPGVVGNDEGLLKWLSEEAAPLLEWLGSGPLDCIDVSHNSLSDEGVNFLVDFMLKNKQPSRRLKMFSNSIHEPDALCNLLEDAVCGVGAPDGLAELHLSHNRISPRMLERLLKSVERRVQACGGWLSVPLWIRVEHNPTLLDDNATREYKDDDSRFGFKLCLRARNKSSGCTVKYCRHNADVHLVFSMADR